MSLRPRSLSARLLGGAALLLVLTGPGLVAPARADEAKIVQARQLLGEANSLFDAGNFAGALPLYEQVYQLVKSPNTLFNLAQTHRQLKHFDKAVQLYEEFRSLSPGSPKAAEAQKYVSDIKNAIKRLGGKYATWSAVPAEAYESTAQGPITIVTLRRDMVIAGVPCRGGKPTQLSDESERKSFLLNPTLSSGHKVGGVSYQEGTQLWFGYGSRVSRGVLAGDQSLDGLPLKSGTEINLYENGRLKQGTLAGDSPVGGVACRTGGEVHLSRQARALQCTLSADQPVGGITAKAGSVFRLWKRNDPVATVTPAQRHAINNVQFKGGRPLYFRNAQESEEPVWSAFTFLGGDLATDQEIEGLPCKAGDRATYEGTRLTSCVISKPLEVGAGIKPKAGTRVWRDEQGRFQRIDLVETHIFNGHEYPANHDVWLDGTGKVDRVTAHKPLMP